MALFPEGIAASLLGILELIQPSRDGCTKRKSARFRARANLEPLCHRLQAALRFFRHPIPACPRGRLATSLPIQFAQAQIGWADDRAYHVPMVVDAVWRDDDCLVRSHLFWGCFSDNVFPRLTRTTCNVPILARAVKQLKPVNRYPESVDDSVVLTLQNSPRLVTALLLAV
jgi:hypothetical protein